MKSVFVSFLDLLKVKYTKDFSNQYFNEHPHKNNLYGLSKMLSEYGIENAATSIADKEHDIHEISTPFIACFSGDFVAVQKVEHSEVSFLWRGINHTLTVAKFIEGWTGVVLLAEASEKSIEPDYKQHKKVEWQGLLRQGLLFLACGLIAGLAYVSQSLYKDVGISLLLLVNIAGLYTSWLLLLKQMHIQSQYADKICSLFKQSDCNNVLDSSAAKLFGIIGWSEVGLGYFFANAILLLFAPSMLSYIALLNVITLPYAFWSIWYQYAKAKQWCPLCLIVQALLWGIFAVNCLYGYIQVPVLSMQALLGLMMVGGIYVALILGISTLTPRVSTDETVQGLRQSINSLKADENIFAALLQKQPFYSTRDFYSIIRFGDPKSSLQLTIFSNPYCNPCSKMHVRIEQLLKKTNGSIGVQYILSSFREELNTTNKYLIAACLASDGDSAMHILSDWFEKGKALRDDYFKDSMLNIAHPDVEAEFQKHEQWRKTSQLRATPIVMVNGYQMPEEYKIEDLQYFVEQNITGE